jgi:hypothetical protein
VQACPILPAGSCSSFGPFAAPNAPPAPATPTYFSEVLSGLTNGTQYQFTVYATNAVGNSDNANAGQAYASTSAFLNIIGANLNLNADTGFSSGALTCSNAKAVTCKDIVAQYAFTDQNQGDVGAAYNLDAEPDNSGTANQLMQCLIVGSLDPHGSGFGNVVNSPDCGPSDKVIRATYPLSANPTAPHLEQEQFDSSITTFTRGEPCFAYAVDKTGTAQCTDPSPKAVYTDPNTGQLTNFCPAQFNPGNMTGYTKQVPCAFVYYLVAEIPGFDISNPNSPRPVPCTSGVGSCGQPAIIGSSLRAGITQNGTTLVRPWCNTSSKNPIPTVIPCVNQYKWLNGDSSSSPNYFDLVVQDYEVGDLLKGGSSG